MESLVEIHLLAIVAVILSMNQVNSDYLCMCNYNIEETVYRDPSTASSAIGYMYEFDCKPLIGKDDKSATFVPVMFEKKVRTYM